MYIVYKCGQITLFI